MAYRIVCILDFVLSTILGRARDGIGLPQNVEVEVRLYEVGLIPRKQLVQYKYRMQTFGQ